MTGQPTLAGTKPIEQNAATPHADDPLEPLALLLQHLHSSRDGLSDRETARRLITFGPNELARRTGRQWPSELLRQVTHPLALVLAVAAVLAWASGTPSLAIAIAAVIVLNAAFAFFQEMQAERAVEALAAFLLGGRVHQQTPARRHRRRPGLRRGRDLPTPTARTVRHRSPVPQPDRDGHALPLHRLGRRRDPPLAAAPTRHHLSKETHS